MDKAFLEGVASLVNVKAEDVSELFETDGNEEKLKEGVNPLEMVKGWVKTRLDDTYKAAERKTSQRYESWVKSQGFESDAQGTDLLAAFVETVKTKPAEGGKASEWEKKYQSLEASHAKALEQLKAKDAEIEKAQREGQVRETKARYETDSRGWLGEKWAGTKEHFEELMRGYDPSRIRYEGKIAYLLDENGEIAKDDLHRPLTLENDVKRRGNLIGGFHVVDPGKGGPPPPKGGSGSKEAVKLSADMTSRQFTELYNSASPEEKPALLEARTAQLEGK